MSILHIPNKCISDKAAAEDMLLILIWFHKQHFSLPIPSLRVDFIAPDFAAKTYRISKTKYRHYR